MRKFIVSLLAVCLLMSSCIQPAGNMLHAQEVTKEVQEDTISASGKIKVGITSVKALVEEENFELQLSKNGYEKKEVISLEVNGDDNLNSYGSVEFSDLEDGNYTLTITSTTNKYQEYKQDFVVEGLEYAIQLYAGEMEVDTQQNAHLGVLQYRMYGEQELKEILDEIEKRTDTLDYDLNSDNVVNLLDLQLFSAYYSTNPKENILSTIETSVPSSIVQSNLGENVEIKSGSLEQVLDQETQESVQLATKEAISEENPLEVSFILGKADTAVPLEGISIQSGAVENQISGGSILIETQDGVKEEYTITREVGRGILASETKTAVLHDDGSISIDFGGQIAVKKVTIKVTATATKNGNLVEISKVEFVNDMENKIPAPELNIPSNLQAKAGNKEFTLNWLKGNNITGYEVSVRTENGKEEVYSTSKNTITIAQYNKDKLKNKITYFVKVRSVNGAWKSPFSEEISVIPRTDEKPKAPDNLVVKGSYKTLDLSWKQMEDTDTYNVYYKKDSETSFIKISGISTNSYQLTNLEDQTKYQVYVTGVNELGEGAKSLTASAKTTSNEPVKMPLYHLINLPNASGELSQHIKSASAGSGQMVNSALDTQGNSALGLFDNDFNSYLETSTWDIGGWNNNANAGIHVTFDNVYQIDEIVIAEPREIADYPYVRIHYKDEQGKMQSTKRMEFETQNITQENGRRYYRIKLPSPIRTSEVIVGLGRYVAGSPSITIAEMRFYSYDSLEDDISNLYEDDLHVQLKNSVDEKQLEDLQNRLDTTDNGEYHLDRNLLQKELDTAKSLFEDSEKLYDVTKVNTNITAKKDGHLGFSGLNAWQPLGVSASANEKIVVYVGGKGKKTGQNVNLQLVATQQHAESSNLSKVVATLKTGRNEITIPELTSTDVERGGALYVQYTGNDSKEELAVRVMNGTKIPVLNLYGVTDEKERQNKINAYMEEVKAHTKQLKTLHRKQKGFSLFSLFQGYDEKTSIVNTTDIMLDQMMISIPASQVVAGTNGDADTLASSLQAMDEMMILFYQQKGLTNSFSEKDLSNKLNVKNSLPSQHLNIRYMKMFAGAFMYAAGNHIGIEWNETIGMVNTTSVQADKDGRWLSGQYFGWGIAHEIGHNINQGKYAIAEVTNNYFSLIAQAKDTNDSVRFDYEKVYDRVTSNVKSRSEDVFTQLAMYWQLHLAYDRYYNYKLFDNYEDIYNHVFFARIDSFVRDTSKAPSPNEIALTLGNDKDQNFMRLASAAAEKDLSEFFMRWGLIPDDTTKAYIEQFEKEMRAIYYVNDEARVYEMEHENADNFLNKNIVYADIKEQNRNKVSLELGVDNADKNTILGYEITRILTENGESKEEVVGFTTQDIYEDTINSISNRSVSYKVVAIDKKLNRSAPIMTKTIKVEGDGSYTKENWNIETNLISELDLENPADSNDPCAPEKIPASYMMIDDKKDTVYIGKTKETPYITIDLGKVETINALRFINGQSVDDIAAYKIEVSKDNKTYTTLNNKKLKDEKGVVTMYFNNGEDPWVTSYDASYIRITLNGYKNKEVSLGEIDVLGPTGDNIEFHTVDGTTAIGILSKDFIYQEKDETQEEMKIPAGSIVFTGEYKGNPAYNVVLLYDENAQIIGGSDTEGNLNAEQIILAPNPGDGLLGETESGKWIYWIDRQYAAKLPNKVRAELYRVDNALTNEGQRLVSDTLFVEIPEKLPEISLTK
ncbi:fibronectin type III domain-containing protein [Amedibacillus dolichus]|uniref:fibronectin type III domain-containing protein n=1 Tax=Amedibacillus dolichus TaxID=31971 RepID=UPI0026741F91|nr:M60 family metallopeptidase [Amedibacillus dolichus]